MEQIECKFNMINDRDKEALVCALDMLVQILDVKTSFIVSPTEGVLGHIEYSDVTVTIDKSYERFLYEYYGVARAQLTDMFDWYFENRKRKICMFDWYSENRKRKIDESASNNRG